MSLTLIEAGNTARVTVTFTPESGTVNLANVTARAYEHDTQTVTALTVVQDSTNVFHADVVVPDDADAGRWTVRFESNSPSPKIAIENDDTSFKVIASTLPNP